jgi:hypothetical protein
MSAGVDSGHDDASFHKGEYFHRQCLVQILASNIVSDILRSNWSKDLVYFDCAEVHSRSVIPLIIDDVHVVIAIIVDIFWLFFMRRGLQYVEIHFLITLFLLKYFRLFDFRGL